MLHALPAEPDHHANLGSPRLTDVCRNGPRSGAISVRTAQTASLSCELECTTEGENRHPTVAYRVQQDLRWRSHSQPNRASGWGSLSFRLGLQAARLCRKRTERALRTRWKSCMGLIDRQWRKTLAR